MSSGCGDVLSLEDLKTAKKHQTFEAEVITGKAGGVASGADIDYATNQVTGQVQKTLPAVLRDAGFRPANFTFTTGGTLTVNDADLAVLWPIADGGDGNYYAWKGSLPKTIPAGSTPAGTGGVSDSGWKPVGDSALRDDLSQDEGATLIGSDIVVSFNTVSDMKSATWIQERMIVRTKGYLSPGDGGQASYRIVSSSPGGLGFSNHLLSNGLYASIMVDGVVFLEQVGGLLSDSSDAFYAAMSISKDVRSRVARTYLISKTIYIPSYTTIDLNGSSVSFTGSTYVDYFMPDGNDSSRNKNITIRNAKINLFYTYGVTTGLPAWNTQSHGNGVVAIRMKYCDGFLLENIEASGGHYGIEIKTSTKGTVRGCTFHDNIDDGISISDGGVVPVQSSDILVELCESYSNGFNDNNVGNSGFEVDDGPRNITFYKCYAHNNESRGFACHVHTSVNVQCRDIRFIECRAENNNNTLQTSPAYNDRGCGFGFGTASSAGNSFARMKDISVMRCATSGHSRAAVLYDCSGGTQTMSGLRVVDCVFNDTSATQGSIYTLFVSDEYIQNNTLQPSVSAPCINISDNRGILDISNNKLGNSQKASVIQYTSTSFAVRANVSGNELSFAASISGPVISFPYALTLNISDNELRGGATTQSAIMLGSTDSVCSDHVKVANNYIEGVGVGVFARGGESLTVIGNTMKWVSVQALSRIVVSTGICIFSNNALINCAADGASGADSSSGNIAKAF